MHVLLQVRVLLEQCVERNAGARGVDAELVELRMPQPIAFGVGYDQSDGDELLERFLGIDSGRHVGLQLALGEQDRILLVR